MASISDIDTDKILSMGAWKLPSHFSFFKMNLSQRISDDAILSAKSSNLVNNHCGKAFCCSNFLNTIKGLGLALLSACLNIF